MIRKRGWFHKSGLLFLVLLSVSGSGCASSSLAKKHHAGSLPSGTLPATIAVLDMSDSVSCDDEGIYLKDYFDKHRVVIDVDLIPDNMPMDAYDYDYVISGSITASKMTDRRSGWGTFVSVMTCGVYYFLGGPTRKAETILDYSFTITNPISGDTRNFSFTDERMAFYGAYGPRIAVCDKPEVYEEGWKELSLRMRGVISEDI